MRLRKLNPMKRVAMPGMALLLALLLAVAGCETKGFLDPGEMMRTTRDPLVWPILDKLNPLDEVEQKFPNAEDVKQADLVVSNNDYVIGRNDLLQVVITEVAGPGMETMKNPRVSESGQISLPLIGSIKAAGLTEAELEKAISQTYADKGLIRNAQVSVTVLEARQRTFSILGMVQRPGQYQIVQADFRIFDALVLAGDVTVQGIDYLYIIRKKPEPRAADAPKAGDAPRTRPAADPLERRGAAPMKVNSALAAANQSTEILLLADAPAADEKGERKVLIDGKWVTVGKAADTKVAAPATAPAATAPAADNATPKPFEFDVPKADTDIRIIRVPLHRLQTGELQYNVVIRPNDTLIIPSPEVGEYYMGGHVARPGVYSLTGRQITLKQAIVSAGMIDPLGWPERTEVIRRLPGNREIFLRVDLPKIFAGEQSDFYLRSYDTINIGSNALSPFLAAIRGAFRFTYGFGFIYDRNYWEQRSQNQ